MYTRYVVAACRRSESLKDPNFPVSVMLIEAASRADAIRKASLAFEEEVRRSGIKDWTHVRVADPTTEEF